MKKAIKIALMILLVATMLFALTGCGERKVHTVEDNDFFEEEDVFTEEEEEEEEEEEKEEEKEEEQVEFSMGEWKDNVYENEFLGLEFNLPEGWTYSSDEEIAKMMNLGTELLNDDQKVAAEVAKLTSAYYMVAQNQSTGDNVTILSEKPLVEVTTEFYLDQLKTQLAAVDSIDYEIGDISKESVAGREYNTLTVKANVSGIELTQKYFIYKMDKYFVCIIATSANGENSVNDMMKSFK